MGQHQMFRARALRHGAEVEVASPKALRDAVTTRLKDLYWALHDDPKYNTPVDYRDQPGKR